MIDIYSFYKRTVEMDPSFNRARKRYICKLMGRNLPHVGPRSGERGRGLSSRACRGIWAMSRRRAGVTRPRCFGCAQHDGELPPGAAVFRSQESGFRIGASGRILDSGCKPHVGRIRISVAGLVEAGGNNCPGPSGAGYNKSGKRWRATKKPAGGTRRA